MELERRNDPDICNQVAVTLGFKDFKALQEHCDTLSDRKAEQLGICFKQEYTKLDSNYKRTPYSYF